MGCPPCSVGRNLVACLNVSGVIRMVSATVWPACINVECVRVFECLDTDGECVRLTIRAQLRC